MDINEYTEDFYCCPINFNEPSLDFKQSCHKYKCVEKNKKNSILDTYLSLYGFCHNKIKQFCKLNNINARNFKNWFNSYRNKAIPCPKLSNKGISRSLTPLVQSQNLFNFQLTPTPHSLTPIFSTQPTQPQLSDIIN